MSHILVKIGGKEDFEKLCLLDYTNTLEKMFEVSSDNNVIKLTELDLPEARINKSENYTDEIKEDIIPILGKKDFIPLVAFYDGKPAGYISLTWESWPNGKVLVIQGILVANQYARKGIAKALLAQSIEQAKKNPECRGVHAEMDTEKYQANKLLLRFGFKFGGSKFFIYSKEAPHKYSKEALYFYYPI